MDGSPHADSRDGAQFDALLGDGESAFATSALGAGASASDRKRELERRRRETLHSRLVELDAVVAPFRKRTGSRKWDKELILSDALSVIANLQQQLKETSTSLEELKAEAEELRAEKNELRNDKAFMRSEMDAVREENRKLRADNIMLWQAFRRAPPQPLADKPKIDNVDTEKRVTALDKMPFARADRESPRLAEPEIVAKLPHDAHVPLATSPQLALPKGVSAVAMHKDAQAIAYADEGTFLFPEITSEQLEAELTSGGTFLSDLVMRMT